MKENKFVAPATQKHLSWVDLLKVIAIFMVIICHAGDSFNFGSIGSPDEIDMKFWGAFWGSAVRPCVPLFIMVTGLLLLPMKDDMGTFYKKRIPRVFFPFLIWSVIFNVYPYIVGLVGGTIQDVKKIFPFAENISLSANSALQLCSEIPVNFSQYSVPMWYVYMLIGLYLFMPIFNAWVKTASKREKEFFLLIWVITLFIPYISKLSGMPQIWGECAWNNFNSLVYFSGYIGYLLLGHYLVEYNKMSWLQTLMLAIPLFMVGYLITFKGFRYMCAIKDCALEDMELFWTYCSINVFMETLAVFIIVQKIKIGNIFTQKFLAEISKYAFGIFLSHYFVVSACYQLMLNWPIHHSVRLLIVSFVALIVTYLVVKVLSFLPKSKYIIG